MSTRVMIVVTHLLGAGHLIRAAALARAAARQGHAVTLVSGGRPSRLVDLDGFDFVQLPPVSGRVDDLRTLRDESGQPVSPDLLAARTALLLETLGRTCPDVIVTELFPFGRRSLRAEFTALLDAAGAMRPRPVVASSVRDILAVPERPEKTEATHALVRRYYDRVLVHGDPDFLPLTLSWPAVPAVADRLAYTGYVDEVPAPSVAGSMAACVPILVSGGSSAAALPLYRAAIEAARILADPWMMLVGNGVEAFAFEALREAAPPNMTVERARSGFRDLLGRAAIFVGQAGYNTVLDLLATRTPALLVPFEAGGETEQRLRADTLRSLGRAALLTESDLDGAALARAVRGVLAAAPPTPIRIDRNGAAVSARLFGEWRAGRDTE